MTSAISILRNFGTKNWIIFLFFGNFSFVSFVRKFFMEQLGSLWFFWSGFRQNPSHPRDFPAVGRFSIFPTCIIYQNRLPQAGDRVLVCIRPAGRCRSTRPSLTWAGLPCLSWARLVSKNVLKSTYPPQVWKHKKTENVQKCISRIESERSLPICCRMWSAKRRPEFAYLLRVFQTLKKANIDFFSTQRQRA